MKILTDDTYIASWGIKTKEGKTVVFLYAYMDAPSETAGEIVNKYPTYFKLQDDAAVVTDEASGIISLDDLIAAAELDDTEYCGVADAETFEVYAGDEDMISDHVKELAKSEE